MRCCGSLGFCALLLLLSAPAWGQTTPLSGPGDFTGPTTTIDFDGFADGTAADTLYSSQGVEFTHDAGGSIPIVDWDALNRGTVTLPNVIVTLEDPGRNSEFSDFIDLIFDTPSPAEVGAFFGNDQGSLPILVELSVFDAGDVLIGSTSFTTTPAEHNLDVDQFIGIRSNTSPIARARFQYTVAVGDLSVALDNVQFSVIPEPSTALLLGLGLIALARRERR